MSSMLYLSIFLALPLAFMSLIPMIKCQADAQEIGTLPYNFTLAAWNTSNTNTTGTPLVLGQNGATTGATFYVTSTWASYPYNDYPSIQLVNNSLHALTASGDWFTNATTPASGRPLGWLASRYYKPVAAQSYSAIRIPASSFPLLAANGNATSWSLCPAQTAGGQVNVIFDLNGASAGSGYDVNKCYGVVLHIVPSD